MIGSWSAIDMIEEDTPPIEVGSLSWRHMPPMSFNRRLRIAVETTATGILRAPGLLTILP